MVDYLTQDLKDQLLNEMNGNLNINLEFNTILFAYASNNFGLSFGTLFNTYAKIDEQYLELILNGNEYERDYMFTKNDNDVSLLAIQDLTLAFGGYSLNYLLPSSMDYLPKQNTASLAYLVQLDKWMSFEVYLELVMVV